MLHLFNQIRALQINVVGVFQTRITNGVRTFIQLGLARVTAGVQPRFKQSQKPRFERRASRWIPGTRRGEFRAGYLIVAEQRLRRFDFRGRETRLAGLRGEFRRRLVPVMGVRGSSRIGRLG